MGIIRRKPRNASLRYQTFVDTSDLTKTNPEPSLTKSLKKSGGRNTYGRITVRHRGGGAKQKYRIIDFFRSERGVVGTIKTLEYDPNRNVHIGLVVFENGAKHYMLIPEGVEVGTQVMAGEDVEVRVGNSLPLRSIPVGFTVHNVELMPNAGGKICTKCGHICSSYGKRR